MKLDGWKAVEKRSIYSLLVRFSCSILKEGGEGGREGRRKGG
jgi:hypothetical protein